MVRSRRLTLRKADAAWLAAAVDGEGSISLIVQPNGGRGPVLMVSNTSRAFIEHAAALMGVPVTQDPLAGRAKPIYRAYCRRRELLEPVLSVLLPHLIIKRGRAEAVLAWFSTWKVRKDAANAKRRAAMVARSRQLDDHVDGS